MIWFTSDTHYSHSNICKGTTTWDDAEISCRNFQTVEEMNELIIKNINDCVGKNDILYHLGDWSFGGIESIWEFRKRIICKNIHLVLGNHDHHIKKNKVLPNCHYDFINGEKIVDGSNLNIFNDSRDQFLEALAQDLFKSVSQILEITFNKQKIILSHFPMEEWELGDSGSIHLHGHCHHTKDYSDLNMYYRRQDVGMDNEEFKPYLLEELVDEINKRKIYKRYE